MNQNAHNAHVLKMIQKPGQLEWMKQWFLITCHKGKEEKTFIKLGANGFEAYLPMQTVDKRLHPSKEIEPTFPCYLFCRMDMSPEGDDWLKHSRVIHPARVVKTRLTKKPEVVQDGLILALKAIETDGVIESHREYQVGEEVRIKTGAFTNFVEKIQRLPGKDRVVLLLGGYKTEMDLSEVEPVE